MHSTRGSFVVASLLVIMPLISGIPLVAQIAQQESGSGAAVSADDDAALWKERERRAEGFRTAALQARNLVDAFRRKQETAMANVEENRTQCRTLLRKANRDTQFGVLLECFDRELLAIRALLEAEGGELGALPGTDPLVRGLAMDRLALLLDAQETVENAVDAGVFRSQEDLLEARNNLWQRYRAPYAAAALRLRADALRTWTAHLLVRMRRAGPDIDEVIECWSGYESILRDQTGSEYADLAENMRQAESAARECIALGDA